MEKTTIKAVEMVREVRNAHHEALKDKTWEERVAFYRAQARVLHEEIEQKRQVGKVDENS